MTDQSLLKDPEIREALQKAVRTVQEAEEKSKDDYFNASEKGAK